MAVTIKDIAKAAQVDKAAVSLTLRNHPEAKRLRPETRERRRLKSFLFLLRRRDFFGEDFHASARHFDDVA